MYGGYDPDVLFPSGSREEAAGGVDLLRAFHPDRTTVVTMELCLGSASTYDACPLLLRFVFFFLIPATKRVIIQSCLFRYPFDRDAGGNIPEADALAYAVELLCAVEHVALCGFAHMDIKPDNLLVAAARGGVAGEVQIVLGDFGTVTPLSLAMEKGLAGAPVRLLCRSW